VLLEVFLLPLKCTKTFGGWGFAPDPTGGAYSAPPDPLAGFRGPTSKGGEEGRGGGGGKGRGEGRIEGKGRRKREGRGWVILIFGFQMLACMRMISVLSVRTLAFSCRWQLGYVV